MIIIGITGSTGAGKTTALYTLEKMGARVIDCDRVYHGLLEENETMKSEIEGSFPGVVVRGSLQRKRLGELVFRDEKALADLGKITHKYVAEEVKELIRAAEAEGFSVAAVDAVALIEGGLKETCDTVVGVIASPLKRAERIMAREGLSYEYAMTRVKGQKPDEFFRKNCDYILENNYDDIEEFRRECSRLFSRILGGK